MKSLLAIEWLKIKKYRTFWILNGFFIVLLPLLAYELRNNLIKVNGSNMSIFGDNSYGFPGVWSNIGFWASILIIFLSILVIIVTTNEYSFRTNRQNIIDGWNRLQFYHAKVSLALALSVFATLYVFILCVLFGYANSGAFNNMLDDISKLGYFFILSVNYLLFGLLIGVWIKRSGLAIGLFMLYTLIVEPIVQNLLNWKLPYKVGDYLPLQASDELLPFPLTKMARALMSAGEPATMNYLLVSVVWIALYYFIGRRLLLRSDW